MNNSLYAMLVCAMFGLGLVVYFLNTLLTYLQSIL